MINQFLTTMVVKTTNGFTWKAMIQGQPDEHIMDWRGANYKFLVVRGQPRQGFPTERQAQNFIDDPLRYKDLQKELYRACNAKGSYYPEVIGNDIREFLKRTNFAATNLV